MSGGWRGRALVVAVALGACSGEGAGPAPAARPFSYSTCALGTKVGEFRIQLDKSFTAVSGAVAGGVVPGDVPLLARQGGDCRLLEKRNLFCDPPCDSATTCGEGGACVPYPTNRDAGTVSISGLARSVVMTPTHLGQRYDDTKLPHPGFLPGADVQLRATGGEVGAFALAGVGVAPLELEAEVPVLEVGKDLELRWKPAAASLARIELRLEIDQHGRTPAHLLCDVPDSGAARIDAAMVDALVAAGASGYPKVAFARRTVDATMVNTGCVELLVDTAVERALRVAGHDPCKSDRDCPAGKTCAPAVETCR